MLRSIRNAYSLEANTASKGSEEMSVLTATPQLKALKWARLAGDAASKGSEMMVDEAIPQAKAVK